MKTSLYFLLIVTFMLTGCDIDRFPYDSIASDELLGGEGGLEYATLGNYSRLKGDNLGNGFMPELHRLGEYPGDNVSLSGTTTDPLFFIYNYNNISNGYRTDDFWTPGYQAIVGCNKVIELTPEGESVEKDQLVGENYYLRAYAFFEMVNVFGRPYVQGRSNLGVPLKLTTDVNDLPDRNTVGEVYDQVVADLLKAETLMTINKSNSYATKEAAQALLSRVYLYMEENQKAIDYADKVISSGRFTLLSTSELPNYTALNPDNNTETIFCFKFLEESDYESPYGTVGGLYAQIDNQGYGEMYASSSYLDILRKNPSDSRFGFIDPQYLKDDNGEKIPAVHWITEDYNYIFRRTFIRNGKTFFTEKDIDYEVISEEDGNQVKSYYLNNGKKVYVINDFDIEKRNGFPKYFVLKCSLQDKVAQLWSPVVSRLAEMYLIKAEAYAKSGNVAATLENVNVIRDRAGIPAYTDASDFPEGYSLLDIALEERRLELAFEGQRKFDVFRNNRTMDRKYPGTHLTGANPRFEIAPTDKRVIEFIPENQIFAQPTLQQNE